MASAKNVAGGFNGTTTALSKKHNHVTFSSLTTRIRNGTTSPCAFDKTSQKPRFCTVGPCLALVGTSLGIMGAVVYQNQNPNFIFSTTSATNCEAADTSQMRRENSGNLSKTSTNKSFKNFATQKLANDSSNSDINKLRMCGEWCAKVPYDTPCRMDPKYRPCRDSWCQTKAGLWNAYILGPRHKLRPVSCDLYKLGAGYPLGATPCDPSCLIPEVRKGRYPQPTGFGILCKPGTCIPGASPHHQKTCPTAALGDLQCPCNWFGSECENDWLPLQGIHKERVGYLDRITITLDHDIWRKVVKDYQPGCVIRINMKEEAGASRSKESGSKNKPANKNAVPVYYELSCAVAKCDIPGQIEVLVAAPDPNLNWQVRHLAELFRSLPNGHVHHSNNDTVLRKLKVNPLIAGFFNGRYESFLDVLKNNKPHQKQQQQHECDERSSAIEHVVLVATGAGISGVLTAIEHILVHNDAHGDEKNQRPIQLHLLYGVRDVRFAPCSERLQQWVQDGVLKLVLVESGGLTGDRDDMFVPQVIAQAFLAGERMKQEVIQSTTTTKTLGNETGKSNDNGGSTHRSYDKVYVQDILQHYELVSDSNLLEKSAFVVCGRLEVMDATRDILLGKTRRGAKARQQALDDTNRREAWVQERLFFNI